MKWKNWERVFVASVVLLVLMVIPITRSVILWILPLGSGLDDLVVVSLAALTGVMLIARLVPVKNKLRKFAEWLMK